MKDNPKHVQAMKEGKVPLEFIPLATLGGAARVLAHGAVKYGKRNWRIDCIKASTYQGAIMRHLTAYYDGETFDPDSGENHLSHIIANCMVLLDAGESDTLINDRDEKESINDKSGSSTDNSNSTGNNWQCEFELEGAGSARYEQSVGRFAGVGGGIGDGQAYLKGYCR